MVGIYIIKNLINGKIYIGQSINIKKRFTAHKNRAFNVNSNDFEKPLYRAFRKYGLKNFSFEVLEECKISELNQKENYWIKQFNSNLKDKGYNLVLNDSESRAIVLNNSKAKDIQNELINSELSEEMIAKKYQVSQRLISGINLGENWYNENLIYPLRKQHYKENKKYCQICGKEISLKANLCVDCLAKTNRKVERPNRQQLKQLIREKSFVQIGKQFQVSDNAIRNWCKFYNLPYKKSDIKKFSDDDWILI